ncbi:restriction endonuclease subunit S [Gordonia amicalis]|uniref:restriction endonuclease subunit S n=1 Tax=Gordonia amicalis TaxID=89053 RepID=UPI0002A64B49|nr:restriction endonuclease subunit S [Gordonia amicalis]NKX78655.1 hypothetical protein [Gordonia amicalis]GAC55536.1 hypothetical protein GOAMI_57_00030 [Gordonia amicalis NBRC 100051 = JCM 11271]
MRQPATWVRRPISDLVDVLDGRRVPVSAAERASRTGDVPYYGATGQVGWIDSHIFDEELVLLGEDGVQFFDPLKPKAYRIVGPSWVNNHAHVLRPRDGEVDARYLTHYLNQFDYRGHANGTTRLKLTQAAMRRISVIAPPIDEQRWIVGILEDHLSRLEAGERGLDSAGRRTALLRDQVLAHAIGGVYVSEVPLKDLLEVGLANGRSVPTQENGFPVLRLTALRGGRIDLSERKAGAWTAADAERYLVRRGDFLIARGNGSLRLVGLGGLVTDEPDPVAYPDTLIRARPISSKLLPEYLALVWNSRIVRNQIESRARTTAGIYKVNQKDLASIVLQIPSPADQAAVVTRVSNNREAIARLDSERTRAASRSRALRAALRQAAFSGQLSGSSPDLDRVEESMAKVTS